MRFELFKELGPSTDDLADYSIVEQTLREGLEGVDTPRAGKASGIPIAQKGTDLPRGFELGQTYPNPFNPRAIIPFSLSEGGNVRIATVDIVGRLVESGRHRVTFDAGNLASGIYLVRADWASDGQSGSQARVLSLIK